MGWRCSTHVGIRYAYTDLVGKLGGRRSLWKPRHRYEDNKKMDLKEIRSEGMDCIQVVRNRTQYKCGK